MEEIKKIWEEMKELKRLRGEGRGWQVPELEEKFEEVDILFGHESTLSKAIIYYLDNN